MAQYIFDKEKKSTLGFGVILYMPTLRAQCPVCAEVPVPAHSVRVCLHTGAREDFTFGVRLNQDRFDNKELYCVFHLK